MPSSHSAFVVGLVTAVAVRDGTKSTTFAVSVCTISDQRHSNALSNLSPVFLPSSSLI